MSKYKNMLPVRAFSDAAISSPQSYPLLAAEFTVVLV